jgi:endonuclease III
MDISIEMTEKERARAVYDRLLQEFGVPVWEKRPAIDELVLTILSQNTNDRRNIRHGRMFSMRVPRNWLIPCEWLDWRTRKVRGFKPF